MIRMRNVRFLNAIHIGSGTTFHLKETEWEMHLREGIIWVRSRRPMHNGKHIVRGFSWNNVVSVEPHEEDVEELWDLPAPDNVATLAKPPPPERRARSKRMVPHAEVTDVGAAREMGAGPEPV